MTYKYTIVTNKRSFYYETPIPLNVGNVILFVNPDREFERYKVRAIEHEAHYQGGNLSHTATIVTVHRSNQ